MPCITRFKRHFLCGPPLITLLLLCYLYNYIRTTMPITQTRETLHRPTLIDKSTVRQAKLASQTVYDKASIAEVGKGQGHKLKVILLSYMRSGTSITSQMLAWSHQVFYVFEPLCTLEQLFKRKTNLTFVNHTVLALNPKAMHAVTSQFLSNAKGFLDCRVEDIDINTLRQSFMYWSWSTRHFYECIGKTRDDTAINTCVENLKRSCQGHDVTLIKVIRLSMDQAVAMMNQDPDVRLIHLLRDPRAMFLSQSKTIRFFPVLDSYSNDFCRRIHSDLKRHETWAESFQNRSIVVRYEDIVHDPVLSLTRISSLFLGLQVTKGMEKRWEWKFTRKQLPYKWRHELDFRDVALIQQNCKEVMDLVGYKAIDSDRLLKDLSFGVVNENLGSRALRHLSQVM